MSFLKKKLSPLLITLALILTVLPLTAYAAAPTEITTAEALSAIRENPSGSYCLMADIDLSGNWTPIEQFTGTFNGNNFTIKGVVVNVNGDSAGLFGEVKNGTVENLRLVDCNIKNVGSGSAGGISGSATNANIRNCTVTGSVQGASEVGGIVGTASLSQISGCENAAKISSDDSAGGIVGKTTNSTIADCVNTGEISGQSTGGIVGFSLGYGGSIQDCSNRGTLTALGGDIGGIAGAASSPISNCVNYADITITDVAHVCAGGIAGGSTNSSLTISGSQNFGAFDISATGSVYIGGIASTASAISNCHNSGNIAVEALSFSYVGGIAGSTLVSSGGTITDSSNSGNISVSNTAATGAIMAIGGIVGECNATLTRCTNSGAIAGQASQNVSPYVGGIAGRHDSARINDCWNTGTIEAKANQGYAYAGGIAGEAGDAVVLNQCSNSGAVCAVTESEWAYAGGIAGQQGDESVILQSGNSGRIEAQAGKIAIAGGIAGSGYALENCRNIGAVSGQTTNANPNYEAYIGGLMGYARGALQSCYNAGEVSSSNPGQALIGGLVGNNEYGTNVALTNVYYLDSASAAVGGTDQGVQTSVSALNNAQMLLQYSFSGFDFTAVWTMSDGSDYPVLKSNAALKYMVSYLANGSGATNMPEAQIKTHDAALQLNDAEPQRTGYTFRGWSTDAAASSGDSAGASYTANADAVLYAIWQANGYLLIFDPENGSVTPSSKTIYFDGVYGDLPEPTRSGYSFNGWFTAAEGGLRVLPGNTITRAENQTLHAQWTANLYIVEFDANGGEVTPESKSITFDDSYGELPTPTRTGYTFAGWYTEADGGKDIIASDPMIIAEDHTIFAHWTTNSYTVTFDANGGSVTPASMAVDFDGSYGTLPIPTLTGYTFDGWYNGALKVNDGEQVKVAADQTLQAHWTAQTFTLSLNANGGTVTPDSASVVYDKPYGELPAPKRDGHIFSGWYTSANGGQKVESSSMVKITADQTIYARWSRIPLEISTNFDTLNPRQEDGQIFVEKASGTLSYKSSNEKVATIKDGKILAKRPGTTTITVTSSSEQEGTITITVQYSFVQWLMVIFLFGWIWIPLK